MKIPTLGIAVLNRGDLLLRCIESIDYPVQTLHIINNGDNLDVGLVLAKIYERQFKNAHLVGSVQIESFDNIGCSRSWNRIIRSHPGPWVICNNDIQIASGDLEAMVAMAAPDIDMVFGYGYSFFMLTLSGAERIGLFDENVWPAYFEDVDHFHRARISGAKCTGIPTRSVHGDGEGGSCTKRADPDLSETIDVAFRANRQYIIDKWNGMPPAESCWPAPFNGKAPDLLKKANTTYGPPRRPVIHVYAVCWNEEELIPFFLKHYSFADRIVVYDNGSTDSSLKLLGAVPTVEVRSWDTNSQINDFTLRDLKNAAWRESRGVADWVIVVDMDEFLYYPNLLEKLDQYAAERVDLPKIQGYEIVSEKFPDVSRPLFGQCIEGITSDFMSKRVIFNPAINLAFGLGCHQCKTEGHVRESRDTCFKLLHCRYLSQEYFLRRRGSRRDRVSEINRKLGLGAQYLKSDEQNKREFLNAVSVKKKII